MSFKKANKEELTFKNALTEIINDPAVQKNAELVKVLQSAVEKANKNQSIQSIASNLSVQLKSNFAEKELPASVIDLQLKLERYTAIGANGIVTGVFDW
ncbi:bacteriocin immunity protein [Lactobacillus agrestimuris]|uniref:bacteriocin immunity protein n=1 Tax=Lactobacillus agrestimuris TaxID=2941328 RepID=UPI002043D5D0|nr:bacteriocin immunity protein [Lactobacillus agrestimuris]